MAFLNDTFTNVNGTFLPDHDANWEEMPWGIDGGATALRSTISSNRLVGDSDSAFSQVLRYNADPGGDEYDLNADVTFRFQPQPHRRHYLLVRMTPTITTFGSIDAYVVELDGGTNAASIQKLSGGAFTALDTANFTWSDGASTQTFAVRVEVRATGVEVFVDDVSILSTTDTSITQRGRVGYGGDRGDSTEHYIDNLVGEVPVIQPIATATGPAVVGGALAVQLTGAAADGGGAGGPYTWEWRQISGTTVTLSSTTAQNPTFNAPADSTTLVFGLTVTDVALVESVEDEVTVQVIGPENTAVPIGDISVAGWTEVPDDGSPLASALRNTSSADYVHSPDNPNAAQAEFDLTEMTPIQAGDTITLNYIARIAEGATSGSITVYLMEGITQIATRNHTITAPVGTFETFEDTLTPAERDAITDESNLSVILEVTAA